MNNDKDKNKKNCKGLAMLNPFFVVWTVILYDLNDL
jgi:hypothetical protein